MNRSWLFILLVLGVLPAVAYALLTLGMRLGLYDFRVVFGQFKVFVPALTAGSVILAVAAVGLAVRRRILVAAAAIVLCTVSAAMALAPGQMFKKGGSVPPIHDITTDPDSPPSYVATAPLRTEGMNPPEYDRSQLAQQREAYPDIQPLDVPAAPREAFGATERAMKAVGIKVVASDIDAGTLEGTHTSAWFGFKDDVAVRIRPLAAGGSVIDMRSKSRVGRSDLGANAERLRDLRAAILDELAS